MQVPSGADRTSPDLSADAEESRAPQEGPTSTAAGPAPGAATRDASSTAAAEKVPKAQQVPRPAEPLLNGKYAAGHSDDEEAAQEGEEHVHGKRNGMVGSGQPVAKSGRLAGIIARLENGSAHNGGPMGAPPMKGHDAGPVGKLLAAAGKHPVAPTANGHLPALAPPVDAAE